MMRVLTIILAGAVSPVMAQETPDWVKGFRAQIGQCWSVGAAPDDIAPVIVTVGFELDEDARPIPASITFLGHNGIDASDADPYFATARRAIMRCGNTGYNLPPELYDQWRNVELTFDPTLIPQR